MNIDEFKAFVRKHRDQHPSARLPDFDAATPMYTAWFKVLGRRGISDVRALEDASMRMVEKPSPRAADHFVTLCSYAEDVTKARGGATPRDLSTREGAEAASKGCRRGCGGTGLATVWHPTPDPDTRIAPTSAAYCVCALGRWIERNHASKHPETRKCIPDLADVIAGRSVWLAEPPGSEADDNSEWNALAEHKWTLLPAEDRDAWLSLAAERIPCWKKGTKANRLLAVAWAYDPSYVVPPPPAYEPSPRGGPRRAFE